MATGDGPPSRLRDAADRMLGLDPGAPEASRVAVLRRLRDADFLPDPDTHVAVTARSGHGVPAPRVEAAEGEWLRAEVESFAADFFDHPVNDRYAHWRALMRVSERHDGVKDRLDELAPGLGIDFDRFATPSGAVGRLADDVRALFVLPRRVRVAESRKRARAFRSDPHRTGRDRAKAVSELTRRYKPIAFLAGGYLERLVGPYGPAKTLPKPHRIHRPGGPTPAGPKRRSAREVVSTILFIMVVIRIAVVITKRYWRLSPAPAAAARPDSSFTLPPRQSEPREDVP